MAEYQILYWHDIPLQVRARDENGRASRPLSQRFQVAVDNASMQAGLTETDDYLSLLTWSEPAHREGSAQEVVDAIVAELGVQYAKIDWEKTARDLMGNKGE